MGSINKNRSILFMGPSGLGKTTLAQWVEQQFNYQFISGSYFTNMKESKKTTQLELIQQPYEDIVQADFQNLSRRIKNFMFGVEQGPIVSDRSPIDSLVFFIQKVSMYDRSACDIDVMIEHVGKALYNLSPALIFLDYTQDNINKWSFENNGRRIVNKYFQNMISSLFEEMIYTYFDFIENKRMTRKVGQYCGFITAKDLNLGKSIELPVMILHETELEKRKKYIQRFINL